MTRRFFHNISFNTIQLVTNQIFALLIFYLLSKQLSKDEFGEINWALAVFLSAFSILSFGIDQIIIRKIAKGEPTQVLLSMHIFHVIISGSFFYGLLLILKLTFPFLLESNTVFLFVGLGKLFNFFSSPFKQLSAGKERFNLLLFMSVPSNVVKGTLLFGVYFAHKLTLQNTAIIFVMADFLELVVCLFIFKFYLRTYISKFNKLQYLQLVKESLPQLGVNLFSSGIARFDWIFIGLYLSSVKLAEYSFAYKAFELATLPLLIIAPVLIPFFSRLYGERNTVVAPAPLLFLLELEIAIACFVALTISLAWVPGVNFLSLEKYGSVNTTTILIFSLCMPILYLNNFLWTLHFAEGKMKMIFRIFSLTFVLNIAGDIILIPLLKNEGAALAYLFAITVQTALYLQKARIKSTIRWKKIFLYVVGAVLSAIIPNALPLSQWGAVSVGSSLYIIFVGIILFHNLRKQPSFKSAVQL